MGLHESIVSPLCSQIVDQAVAADAEIEALSEQLDTATIDRDEALARVAHLEVALAGETALKVELARKLRRCRRRLNPPAEPPPLREPLFGAKPEPNTEAEYADGARRAGVPYRVHRHYATTWSEAVDKASACTGQVCALTVSVRSEGRFIVNRDALAAMPDGRQIWMGYQHEFSDDVRDGRFSLDEVLDANMRCGAAITDVNGSRQVPMRFGVTEMGYVWRGQASHMDPSDFWIDGLWDHIGTDVYTELVNRGDQFGVTATQMLSHEVAFGLAHDVDVTVMEWGISAANPADAPTARADKIREVNGFAREHEILAVSYWDHGTCSLRSGDEFAAAGGA